MLYKRYQEYLIKSRKLSGMEQEKRKVNRFNQINTDVWLKNYQEQLKTLEELVKVKLLRKINSKKLNYDEKLKKVFSSAKIKQQILRICQEKKWNGS